MAFTAAALACGGGAPPGSAPDTPTLNTSLPPIEVRYDLAPDDVELAVLLGVANPAAPPALEPGAKITDAVLLAVVGDAKRTAGSGDPWYFVGRRPGLVFAGYEREEVTMQVAIRYDTEIVLLRIVESRNLGQTDGTIHAEAFARLATLDRRIRRSLLAVAQRNHYGKPIPASP